jgi:hypothetical protein
MKESVARGQLSLDPGVERPGAEHTQVDGPASLAEHLTIDTVRDARDDHTKRKLDITFEKGDRQTLDLCQGGT